MQWNTWKTFEISNISKDQKGCNEKQTSLTWSFIEI